MLAPEMQWMKQTTPSQEVGSRSGTTVCKDVSMRDVIKVGVVNLYLTPTSYSCLRERLVHSL